jgi:membrane protease YdiL (CAAX protease family)
MYQINKPPGQPYISEEERRALQSPSVFSIFWSDYSSNLRVHLYASAYILVILIIGALGNYYGFKRLWLDFVFWTALYLPALIFPRIAGWNLTQMGFALNLRLLLVSGLLLMVIAIPLRDSLLNFRLEQLPAILIQTYARTGEEFFFRGFIFLFALQIFRSQKWPALWAVALSTMCFTWVHTQALLPGSQTDINAVVLFALVVGLLRAWTASLLPGIIAHLMLNGAPPGILLGGLAYLIIAWLARNRGETPSLLNGKPSGTE